MHSALLRTGDFLMTKPALQLVSPSNEKRAVHLLRRPNAEYRTREHLTEAEVERLIETARANRHGPPRRHGDPDRLPAWAEGFGALPPALEPGRTRQGRRAARQPS